MNVFFKGINDLNSFFFLLLNEMKSKHAYIHNGLQLTDFIAVIVMILRNIMNSLFTLFRKLISAASLKKDSVSLLV